MANFHLPNDLRSLRVVVKRLPNWLRIGVQAGFGPNFTVEFEAEIPKKNWAGLMTQRGSLIYPPQEENLLFL